MLVSAHRIQILILAALLALPSATLSLSAEAGAAPAAKKQSKARKRSKAKKPRKRGAKQRRRTRTKARNKANPARVEISLRFTSKVIRAAAKATRGDDDARAVLSEAVVHQRAARLAQRKRKASAALWLTRAARTKARGLLADAGKETRLHADRRDEWRLAKESGAQGFLDAANKMKPSDEVAAELKAVKELIAAAAEAVKAGGNGKAELGQARAKHRSARKVGRRGKSEEATKLLEEAREAAEAAIAANGDGAEDGESEESDEDDEDGESEEASEDESEDTGD